MNSPKIIGTFRLENHDPKHPCGPRSRVWIDIKVDGVSAQSMVWYSGPRGIAEDIVSGKKRINEDCLVVDCDLDDQNDSMTVGSLISKLQKFDSNMPFMILDGFNGGGTPRSANLGPHTHTITPEESQESADCESIEGKTVLVLGFGCY